MNDEPAKEYRQKEWRRRRRDAGLCPNCGRHMLGATTSICPLCLVKARERNRKRLGCTRRYRSASYQLQEKGGIVTDTALEYPSCE